MPAAAKSSFERRCHMTSATKVLTVQQALAAWVAQEEERNRLTQEALADVDAGRVINHQAVQTWADSLGTDLPLPVPR
ncbi:MAG: CopG family transcriptional regulator [Halothiobacillus sp. 20-53-49]|nr:MAG: CopG family transcriptional regulator [Halothiobacillus sp. 20-53-49]